MPTTEETLAAAAAKLDANATAIESVVNGPAAGVGSTVNLPGGGTQDTLSKALAQFNPSGYETVLNVTAYGATGDGTTDDTAAVQAALDALEASTTADTLYFPKGTYRLDTLTANSQTNTASNVLLTMGTTAGLDGRAITLTGDPGATLYSTSSPTRAHILLVNAKMLSLWVKGLRIEKDEVLLSEKPGGEPNGCDGIAIIRYDRRVVESVRITNCKFVNCHGPVRNYNENGNNIFGKLRMFSLIGCELSNPWGSNTTNGETSWGGGQQVILGPWVDDAFIGYNRFVGQDDEVDLAKNPGGTMKDAAFFGSPQKLLFKFNSVRNYGIECVFMTANSMLCGYTSGTWTMPVFDGSTTVDVPIGSGDSTFTAGEIISFYASIAVAPAIMEVTAWNEGTQVVTVKNTGASTNAASGTLISSSRMVYEYRKSNALATIVGNSFSHAHAENTHSVSGGYAVVLNERGVVTGNTFDGFGTSVRVYPEVKTPGIEQAGGSVICDNVMRLPDPALYTGSDYCNGVYLEQGKCVVADNAIESPGGNRCIGIRVRSSNNNIHHNTAISIVQQANGYTSVNRTLGISESNGQSGNVYEGNKTQGFDVGIGPESASSMLSSRVISHQSVGDVVGIDRFMGNVPQEGMIMSFDANGEAQPLVGSSIVKHKTVTESRSETITPTDDADLQFEALANAVYYFRIHGNHTGTGGFRMKLDAPLGATVRGTYSFASAGAVRAAGRTLIDGNVATTTYSAGEGHFAMEGVIKTSSTPGKVALQWAQNTSDVAVLQVQTGSVLFATLQGPNAL